MRDLDALLSVQPCSLEQSEWFAGIHSPQYRRSRHARRRFTSPCTSLLPPFLARLFSRALPRALFLARLFLLLPTPVTFAREENRLPVLRPLEHDTPLRRAIRARCSAAVDRA